MVFSRWAYLLKIVPHLLVVPFRTVVRVALEEATAGSAFEDLVHQERGWKLFLLLSRRLLQRPPEATFFVTTSWYAYLYIRCV